MIKKVLYNSISILVSVICACVYLGVLLNSVKSSLLIIPTIFFLIIGYVILHKKGSAMYFNVCYLLMIIIQIVVGYYLQVEYSSWDVHAVTQSAAALVNNENFNELYFARYPNNIAILLLFTLIYKLTNFLFHSTSVQILIAINIVAIDIAVILGVKLLKMICSEEGAYRGGIMMTMFAPFYLYVPICYTDTFSMPVVVGGVYWIIYYAKNHVTMSRWSRILHLLGLGAVLFLGFKLKGSLIVILIAALMYFYFKFECRKFVKIIVSLMIGFSIAAIAWGQGVKVLGFISDEEYDQYQFPATHWIMMGLEGLGNFNPDDVGYTLSFSTYDEKKEATVAKIFERVEKLGCEGVVKQFYKKSVNYGWNYGTCYAERYIGDFGDMPIRRNILHEFVLSQGKWHQQFYLITQSIWLFFFGAAILEFVLGVKNCNYESLLLRLIIFGCMLFFMIWETHPRYILNYTPIVIIAGAMQLDHLLSKIKEKVKK